MKNAEHKYRRERDKEFMEMYRSAYKEYFAAGSGEPKLRAIDFTLANGKPHYHVSLDRALHVVPLLLKGRQSPLKPESMQDRMWREITEKVASLLSADGLALGQAIDFVITTCRASRFYISPGYARQLVSLLDSNRA
mgnify:CR=1 FL=1